MESHTAGQNRRENRLANEKSPYLLQHKFNPVEWYPWGTEAFEKAKKEDKMIFLSVGYSTCHWCHVMARESFENEDIAKVMNESFVNIKVDREERPDIDKIYMTYVQAISGGGGWPMSVWLTPDLKPIVGGTYFPPNDSYGRRGFPSICLHIAKLWNKQREDLVDQGTRTIEQLQQHVEESQRAGGEIKLTKDPIYKCYDQITKGFDPHLGGFTGAPKFPRPVVFNLLFHILRREGVDSVMGKKILNMINLTLTKMGQGGMFDHLGGGFHRYSVTADWLVPHFEKMLYDQAQLVIAYLEAFNLTGNTFYEQRARDVLGYVMNTITSPDGGIYSAEDADSPLEHGKPEHAEGAFYIWAASEIEQLLGEERAKVFNIFFGVQQDGNVPSSGDPHGEFTGKNILMQRMTVDELAQKLGRKSEEISSILEQSKNVLFSAREKRPRPHLDDKIITAWNGLMISAYARAYQILADERYLNAGKRAATFIKQNLFNKDKGTLIRNYRNGPSNIEAFTDDYAFLVSGLLDLYEASGEIEWLKWAVQLQEKQNELFWDSNNGGYFGVHGKDETLLLRMKEDYDGAEPSNNSVSAHNLLRLHHMLDNKLYKEYSEKTFGSFLGLLEHTPVAAPQMCVALDFYLSTPIQVVLAGHVGSPDLQALLKEVHKHHLPNKVVLFADQKEGQQFLSERLPFIKDMHMLDDKATAYICQNYTCNLPVNTPDKIAQLLAKIK